MSIAEETAWEVNVDSAGYHGDHSAVSHTMLKCFSRSRRKYGMTYVEHTLAPSVPTDAMVRGQLLHLLQLEPERWDGEYVHVPYEAPDGKKWYKRKGSDHERWWEWFEFLTTGKLRADDKMVVQVRGMAEAILAEPRARKILEADGPVEHTIYWVDEETGLTCKSRRDKWVRGAATIADLKSAKDISPAGFAKQVEALGYYRQAPWYLTGHEEWCGEVADFVFIAVEPTPPYEVALHRLDADWLKEGDKENRKHLRALAKCQASGRWSNTYQGCVNVLSRPAFGKYKHEWEMETEDDD